MHGKIHAFKLSCTACFSFSTSASGRTAIAVQLAVAVFGLKLAGADNLVRSSSEDIQGRGDRGRDRHLHWHRNRSWLVDEVSDGDIEMSLVSVDVAEQH